jgi:hypothetical protein
MVLPRLMASRYKNVGIRLSEHSAFLGKHSWGMLKVETLESQIIVIVLGTSKPKVLNSIAKIGQDHLCLREENIGFNNNYMI